MEIHKNTLLPQLKQISIFTKLALLRVFGEVERAQIYNILIINTTIIYNSRSLLNISRERELSAD